jgi:hypothetical protein
MEFLLLGYLMLPWFALIAERAELNPPDDEQRLPATEEELRQKIRENRRALQVTPYKMRQGD